MMTYNFLLHNYSVHIILFNVTKITKFYRTERKISVEAWTGPLLWNANYDRENDYTNNFRPRRFKLCNFLTNFM